MTGRTVVISGFACLAAACTLASAQTFTNAQLLAEAGQAYDQGRCVRAARFAFAYLVRNPATDQALHQSLETIITWCEGHTSGAAGTKGENPYESSSDRPTIKLGAPGPDPVSPQRVAGVVVAPPPPRPHNGTEKRCYLYATLAVEANRVNEANGCTFSGGRWSSAYDYHYNWCIAVPATETESESLTRLQMLNQCAP
jgi:hypothetical protein